jgi:hypothetical protein
VPDYRDHLAQAREYLEAAAQSGPEGRAAVRRWAGEVADALPEHEPPDAVLDPAAQQRAAQVRAAQELGYELALPETGGAGIELYPDVRLAGHYEDSGLYPGPGRLSDNGGHMQYDAAAIARAQAEDEVARYGLMLQGGRPAPAAVRGPPAQRRLACGGAGGR